jgi:hypothetical protein
MLKRGESSVVVNLRADYSQLMSPKAFENHLRFLKHLYEFPSFEGRQCALL